MKLEYNEFIKYLPLLNRLSKSEEWAYIEDDNFYFCKICCKSFFSKSWRDMITHGTIHIEENKHLIPFM